MQRKKTMELKTKENIILHWEDVKPIELERILNLYGMKKSYYCQLYGKSRNWFHEVLRKRKYLTFLDIKTLSDYIGADIFNSLLEKVRTDFAKEK